MGCGASKEIRVDSRPRHNPISATTKQDQYNNDTTIHSTATHHQQIIKHTEPTKVFSNGDSLPPPRPPDQSLEELLSGKEDILRRSDQHAQSVSFDNAVRQGLTEFTDKTLIPRDTVEERETVQIVEDTEEKHTGNDPGKPVPSTGEVMSKHESTVASDSTNIPSAAFSQIPGTQATAKDNVDATELLLEKHKRDTEKAKNLMMVDKMRHNITLQDKLAKRREMKRRADIAQATVTAGEVSDEIGAKQRRTEDEVAEEGVENAALAETTAIAGDRDASIALADVALGGEPEAPQDRHDAVMAQAAPEPTAPETRKEAIYGDEDNIELFKDLEDFAVNMEQISSPTTTFAVLMKSLLINQLSDLEKVRILFHWITKQDLNSINFPSNITEDTPMGFLLAIKNGKKTYAELFSRLCSAAGLHAKVITGYLKGVGYLPDYKFTGVGDSFRGSWNAVLIDGQWRLIDTHWGARHVLEDDGAVTAEQVTVYKYEEHYFLTNPDQLIVTHFPYERDWQLLRQPVTLEQYQDTAKVWPLHHKLKLSLQSHPNGVVIAPPDGVVEIRITTSEFARLDAEFKCDFMTKTKQRQVGQINLACCTFHYIENEFQVFQVHCPAPGEYLLKIFGMSQKFSDDNVFTNIAFYQINCPKLKPSKISPKDPLNIKTSDIHAPFPEANTPWGPPHLKKASQILPVSHNGPILSCDKNGEATLVMQLMQNKQQNFLQRLFTADGTGRLNAGKESLPDRAVHFFTTSKSGHKVVVFRIRTPGRGNYALSLYMNNKSEDTFEGFCNYFVVSEAQSDPTPPFPSVPNGALGENAESCLAINIRPTVYPKHILKGDDKFVQDFGNGWIRLSDDNEGYVTFDHLDPANVLADLEGNDGIDLVRSILVEDNGKRASIIIRPPKAKNGQPEYRLRIYASAAAHSSSIPCVFNAYIIGARKDPKLFPLPPSRRWGPNPSQSSLGLSVVAISNSAPLFNIDVAKDSQGPSPCRLYKGGDDITIRFAMKQQLILKSLLSIDKGGKFQEMEEESTFFAELNLSEATLGLKIPKPGDYCLSLYGSEASSGSNQLSPLYYMLIHATSSSDGTGFPRSFGIWSSGVAKLHSPVNKYLKRNAVNKIKVTVGDVSQGVVQAFPSVLLLTEQSQPVEPSRTDSSSFTYEWDYVPGPREKMLSLVVRKNPGDSSLSYVLQFEVSG